MNLLELMLKEEVKWPVGAEYAAQDGDDCDLWFFNKKPSITDGCERWCCNFSQPDFDGDGSHLSELSSDWSSSIITREEYKAAGGWMKWEGGECPVDGKATVDTKWDCDTRFECLAEKTTWMREPDGASIIAYRIIKQDESGFVADDEPILFAEKETEGVEMPCDNEWKPLRDTSSNMTITVINKTGSDIDVKIDGTSFEPFVSVEDAQGCMINLGGAIDSSVTITASQDYLVSQEIKDAVQKSISQGRSSSAATAKQQAPKGSGNPILGMVLADLTNRALEGKEKYGEPLKAHNGRNALWDAYQEALDLPMYLRQLIEEQQDA